MKHELESTVFVVDSDPIVRNAIRLLLESIGLKARLYVSATDYLRDFDPAVFGCLVLEVRMPGMSGLDLQRELIERDAIVPIIFVTGHGDIHMAVGAVKAGAFDFIQKPFRDQELLDTIQGALAVDRTRRCEREKTDFCRRQLQELSLRERQVLDLVVDGKPNKAIAYDLGLSEKTIEYHRSRLMKRLKARSVPDLVRIVLSFEAPRTPTDRSETASSRS